MMTKEEYLLTVLSEECAEVQQAVSKILRFGKNNFNPMTEIKNLDQLQTEIIHIYASVNLLIENSIIDEDILGNFKNYEESNRKKEKVLCFYDKYIKENIAE